MALSPWHHSLFICPLKPQIPLAHCSPLPSVHRRMGDQTNMRNSTKSADEKHSFEDSVVTPTWFTSAANVTRKISEKLLAWGVEERGAYPMLIFEHAGQA